MCRQVDLYRMLEAIMQTRLCKSAPLVSGQQKEVACVLHGAKRIQMRIRDSRECRLVLSSGVNSNLAISIKCPQTSVFELGGTRGCGGQVPCVWPKARFSLVPHTAQTPHTHTRTHAWGQNATSSPIDIVRWLLGRVSLLCRRRQPKGT